MADIRLLEPLITWPKNLIVGGVRGLFEGMRIAAPWGLKLGAVLGVVAGMGTFGVVPLFTELAGVGAFGAVNGLLVGAVSGAGVGIAAGGAVGTVSGAAYGLTNSGADHHLVENRRFKHKEVQHAKKSPQMDEEMYHYLDELADERAADFQERLEDEREMDQDLLHGR